MVKKICYVNPTVLMKRPIAQISKKINANKNFNVSIFIPRIAFKKRDLSSHYSKVEGIKVIDYPVINLSTQSEWPIPGMRFLTKSLKILKENDVIHIWVPFYISSTILILLKRLFFKNKKLILTMDTIPAYSFNMSFFMNFFLKIYFKTIGKLIFSGVDLITVYGESFKNYAIEAGIPKEKIRIIPSGIDLQVKKQDKDIIKEFNIDKNKKIILFVGLLIPRKGIDTILKIVHELKKEEIKVILVGDGPYRKYYEKLTKKLGIENIIIFTGFRKDIHNFYHKANIFLFPSRGEGLAGVLMEASKYGIPIVASNIAGNRDIVKDGLTGYLCPNDVSNYSRKIKELLNDAKICKKLTVSQKKKIKDKFDWEKNIEKFKEVYK